MTNLTPVEACEKIANGQMLYDTCTGFCESKNINMHLTCDTCIATQALQNQQKTFTLDEVKEIVKSNLSNFCGSMTCCADECDICQNSNILKLLAEFEKAR